MCDSYDSKMCVDDTSIGSINEKTNNVYKTHLNSMDTSFSKTDKTKHFSKIHKLSSESTFLRLVNFICNFLESIISNI